MNYIHKRYMQNRLCKLYVPEVTWTSGACVTACSHFCPGSRTPSLLSINPPCTGIPSSSYVSGTVISTVEYFLTSAGEKTSNVMLPTVLTDSSRAILLHLTPYP